MTFSLAGTRRGRWIGQVHAAATLRKSRANTKTERPITRRLLDFSTPGDGRRHEQRIETPARAPVCAVRGSYRRNQSTSSRALL